MEHSTRRFSVEGMSCASCANRVQKALEAIDGVDAAEVNANADQAQVRLSKTVSSVALARAVKDAGYQVATQTTLIPIQGMSCSSCVSRIEKALGERPDILTVSVSLANDEASVTHFRDWDPQAAMRALKEAGYQGRIDDSEYGDEPLESQDPWWPVVLSALLTLPLILPMVALLWGQHWMLPPWWQLLLATPVQFVLGARFYRAAWSALKAGTGNMDLLVAIGTSSAFGLSLFNWYQASVNGHTPQLYFEASAAIITFILLGKRLELRAKRQTARAIRGLKQLRPETVVRVEEGQTHRVPLTEVETGHVLRVKAGDRIPADGKILEGQSSIDESVISGESVPVTKAEGDKVVGGALNLDGTLDIEVTAMGQDSVLSRIVTLVEQAQMEKPPIQALVDRVSAIFVPVVVLVAVVTFLSWWGINGNWQQALINAVSVMVIACPCALGLATPAAMMAGLGRAAQAGILIKDPEAIEQARHIHTLVFDKTGTLTQGKPELTKVETEESAETLVAIAASLSRHSEHPLGQAVIDYAEHHQIQIQNAEKAKVLSGKGISGQVDGKDYYFGSARLMTELGVTQRQMERLKGEVDTQGASLSWIVLKQQDKLQLLGLMLFKDSPRADAKQAVERLKGMGINVWMLTGDNQSSAEGMARELGIEYIKADASPEQKTEQVKKLRQSQSGVAMMGDGINDAPALASADLGLAVSSGTEVAMDAAGITLMRSNPSLAAAALDICRRIRVKIKQNLFWAFVFNTVGIPLAALGYLNPIIAGAAMALSSIMVLSNALLLRRWKAE
ncbi:Cu(+) exporting ATPase [Saliniradius amylolyticus]|uniref:Cu(+) exporting ATPase n=1 Tax=Saliniradius amylolyticus TaxID=2183582 RepID=A0A2S2E5G3_9ALTE|nr:heavy metal translocating P-type ATPase [Saliniradius amylolyticus]AWL12896.1 Cu(+) exporting ATPase [Saliniradius amylolyticus]